MLCAAKFLLQYSTKLPIQNNPSSPLLPSYLLLGILQSIALMKHRKLFPPSKDNNTDPCLGVCDPTCPYGCDPYADIYSIPPPPHSSDKQGHHISPFVIVIVTLLASCFLLVCCYFIVARYFPGYNCFRRRQRQPEATDEEFLDENRGPPIDHPIWYINTIGLQPSVIDSITIFRYKKGDNLVEGTECSVCLNEFQNDETLRLLPKCSHAFHISCIDTWLRSHTNCPVCRAGIICNSVNTPVASTGLNSHSMRLDEDSDVENLENDEELNVNQSRAGEFCENRTDTGEIRELSQVHHDAKLSVVSKSNSVSSVIDGLNATFMIEEGNYERQLMRRSVSVDSLLAANIGEAIHNLSLAECEDISVDQTIKVDHVSGKNIGGKSRTSGIIDGDSSITQFLHKKPVRMKRSFSYAGRSFLSRQNSRNNSLLLPL